VWAIAMITYRKQHRSDR